MSQTSSHGSTPLSGFSVNPLASATPAPAPTKTSVNPVHVPEAAKPAEPPPLPTVQSRYVWDVPFACLSKQESVERIEQMIRQGMPSYVITANLNYTMLHHQLADVKQITAAADLILADGQPIVWRSRLGTHKLPERVAGSELIHDLAGLAARNGWGIYFLGGEQGVADKCATTLASEYPGMRVAGVESPPFRQLTSQEHSEQQQRIRESGAKILLVAFGQPKGERWIFEHYKELGIPVCIQLGASFDFIAGTAKRAPEIWQRVGCEWVYRMMSDPKRLVPRYWSNIKFLAGALVRDWTDRVNRWGMGLDGNDERRSSDRPNRR
ncbi:MAG: WecB/TagA/CpsF family glycosyltransferase [Planctomycetota bacterium]